MSNHAEPRPPKVFLSFAGVDRPAAKCLHEALLGHGIEPFLDELDIEPGQDIFGRIGEELVESDYFVLLWSGKAIGNESVAAEVSAAIWIEQERISTAIMNGVKETRSFLFVVNLDGATPPPLLAPRKYIAFRGDWDAVAETLATLWRSDRKAGRPEPPPGEIERHPRDIEIYVRNQALHVVHVVMIPPRTTGQELMSIVRASLGLKDKVDDFGGQVGARFAYWLEHDNRQLPANKPLAELRIGEHSEINLGVRVIWFGPGASGASETFLNETPSGFNKALRNRLIHKAFGHLMRRYRPAKQDDR